MVATSNGASKHVDDLYGDHFTVALAQAMTRLECAPYWHSGEKAPSRLVRAGELVRLSRVQIHDDRTATVHGSTKPYDITGFHCTCPQSTKGQTHWCVHAVAVKLARTMAEQAPRAPSTDPDDDEALGNGSPIDDETLPLPLPPTSVDERLAQTQGGPMSDDNDDAYVPEPDTEDAPVAVLEASDADFPPLGQAATRALPEPVLLPSLDARTLEQSMQAWSAQRQVVKRFLQQELVEGTDYYTLRIKGRETKPALSKAGSEKFMALFQLHASFSQDTATWTMLGEPKGTLCYVCQLYTRSGEMVGEGRGARTIQQDSGDINKAVKMVCKSSMVDAILRTGALSDVFTQDLEPEALPAGRLSTGDAAAREGAAESPIGEPHGASVQSGATRGPVPAAPAGRSQELRQRIWAMVTAQAPQQATTREAVTAWIMQVTGYDLVPDHYPAIVRVLEARA